MRTPTSVRIDALDANGVATGADARGRRWTVRGAPLGANVLAVGRPKAAHLLGVETPAPDAVAPRCARYGECGGCQLQPVPLERQRAEKHASLARLLAPLGGVDHGIRGTSDGYGYRNKVELSFGPRRYLDEASFRAGVPFGGRFLGMHAPGRFDRVVDLERCELVSDAMNAVLAGARADILASPFALWDVSAKPEDPPGFWRHLVLREGLGGVVASVYTTEPTPEQAAWLVARAPGWGAAGVVWYQNDARGDAAIGTFRALLHGSDVIEETLRGVHFRLSPTAFFQVNPAGAQILCETVAEAAGTGGALLDLYCGTGALGLTCASGFSRVIGIDANVASIENARENAARNAIPAEFHAGDVETVVPELALPSRPVVLLDPPRVGLHPKALAFVSALDAERMVYVACRPTSLLRDGLALQAAGWTCTDRWAIDLFPQTGHVEVVTRWERL